MPRARDLLDRAIANNVAWCDVIAGLHGVPTRCASGAWIADGPMPRFYPNLITLSPDVAVERYIGDLASVAGDGWGIKDSYAALSLNEAGFRIGLHAEWYSLNAGYQADRVSTIHRIVTVRTRAELNDWTSAWGEEGASIFLPGILDRDDVSLLSVWRDAELVAGLAVNARGGDVGISNVFGEADGVREAVRHVTSQAGGQNVFGYGDESEVRTLAQAGARTLGSLRVWIAE